jgi:hypothetical protein
MLPLKCRPFLLRTEGRKIVPVRQKAMRKTVTFSIFLAATAKSAKRDAGTRRKRVRLRKTGLPAIAAATGGLSR